MAAGRGERLQPLTDAVPKALVYLAGKPLLQWAVEHMRAAGIPRVIVAAGWMEESVRKFVQSMAYEGVEVKEVEDYALGPLHTLIGALPKEYAGEVIVAPVDAWLSASDIRGIIESESCDLALGTDYSRIAGTTVFSRDEIKLVGLGTAAESFSEQGSSAMVFRAGERFVNAARRSKEAGLNRVLPVINKMISNGADLRTHSVKDVWFDLDDIQSIITANEAILRAGSEELKGILIPSGDVVECGDAIEIAPATVAEKGVVLRGPVLVAPGCTIGQGSEIGPNVSISEGTHIMPSCKVQNSILFGHTDIAANTSISDVIVYNSHIHGSE